MIWLERNVCLTVMPWNASSQSLRGESHNNVLLLRNTSKSDFSAHKGGGPQ